jgi:hypothetical protein
METRTVNGITEEPTLGALLRSVAYHRLPTQFYQMLQMAIPFAAQLWFWGWKRSAGWMVVVSLFGLWALCEQRVDELGEESPRAVWPRIARRLTGAVGALLAGGLALEGFVQLMRLVFKCPGCAG